jgi:integrase
VLCPQGRIVFDPLWGLSGYRMQLISSGRECPRFYPEEYLKLEQYFTGIGDTRGHLLLVLGCNTGLRISELLGLTAADCWIGESVRRELFVTLRRLKGGRGVHRRAVSGRRIPRPTTFARRLRSSCA